MAKKVATIEVWENSHMSDWYWHLRAKNGEIVASAEAYSSRGNALRAARRAQKIMAEAVIVEITK